MNTRSFRPEFAGWQRCSSCPRARNTDALLTAECRGDWHPPYAVDGMFLLSLSGRDDPRHEVRYEAYACMRHGCLPGRTMELSTGNESAPLNHCAEAYVASSFQCNACAPRAHPIYSRECVACTKFDSVHFWIVFPLMALGWFPLLGALSAHVPVMYSVITYLQITSTITNFYKWSLPSADGLSAVARALHSLTTAISFANFNLQLTHIHCVFDADQAQTTP